MPRRDAHLPIGDMRRKPTLPCWRSMSTVPSSSRSPTAAQYMERGALADLAEYAGRGGDRLPQRSCSTTCSSMTRQDFRQRRPRLCRVAPTTPRRARLHRRRVHARARLHEHARGPTRAPSSSRAATAPPRCRGRIRRQLQRRHHRGAAPPRPSASRHGEALLRAARNHAPEPAGEYTATHFAAATVEFEIGMLN